MKTNLFSPFFLIVLSAVALSYSGCVIKKNTTSEEKIINLRGEWKFSIGDDLKWASPGFNDNLWEEITVPSSWEEQGFHGYNGYAWYRKSFELKIKEVQDRVLYLYLGYVDDVDETYLNGHLIGVTGSFPPGYETAYDGFRKYLIPQSYLNPAGNNVIAIRVYDEQLSGGIIKGDVGIYGFESNLVFDINLAGNWKFHIGDEMIWKEKKFNDSSWANLIVPSKWENQGFKEYDGYAWYRKTIQIPDALFDKNLFLLLGKIDDLDQTFINGQLIGSTGELENIPEDFIGRNEWNEKRSYLIPKNLKSSDGIYTIAIRVYDGFRDGGIYEGPIGIITREKYSEYLKQNN
jgi:sialate O-acetylesterase